MDKEEIKRQAMGLYLLVLDAVVGKLMSHQITMHQRWGTKVAEEVK